MTHTEIAHVRHAAATSECFVPAVDIIVDLCDMAALSLYVAEERDRYIARNRELEARLATIREVCR